MSSGSQRFNANGERAEIRGNVQEEEEKGSVEGTPFFSSGIASTQ